jgi:hypothetical protein
MQSKYGNYIDGERSSLSLAIAYFALGLSVCSLEHYQTRRAQASGCLLLILGLPSAAVILMALYR